MRPVEPSQLSTRLEAIPTRWSLIRLAHGNQDQNAALARNSLVLRYSSAVRRYLGAIVKDDADDLAQDLIARMLRGDFSGADPARGRFRDLLKTASRNLARNHWAKEKRRSAADYDLNEAAATTDADPSWENAWQRSVLDHTFDALREYERDHPGSFAHTLLTLRRDQPDLASPELAAALSQKIGQPVKPDTCRQWLRRARLKFAELLIDEVAIGLPDPTPDKVEDELISLGLHDLVKDLLPADWRVQGMLAAAE